jgi:chromatin structure-remodeling complex subunit RSC1/2
MARYQVDPSTEAHPRQFEAEEPVQSIEDDSDQKDDTVAPSLAQRGTTEVTEDQWRVMMEVVMAIYDYREEECVLQESPTKQWMCHLTLLMSQRP